jgi:hypothetical protein
MAEGELRQAPAEGFNEAVDTASVVTVIAVSASAVPFKDVNESRALTILGEVAISISSDCELR